MHLIYTRLNKNWTDSGTHFCSVVARDLAEGFVAIDDGIVDDLSVSQEETAVGCQSTLMSPKIEKSNPSVSRSIAAAELGKREQKSN